MNILIAGASSGIGAFLAQRLIEAGHSVSGFSRSGKSPHEQFRGYQCDIADWAQVSQLARTIQGEGSALDAIIVCAAIQGPIGPALDVDPVEWSAAIRVNLDGTFHVLRAFVPLLRDEPNRRSKVLCFSGGGASKARPNFSSYGAAKTAVVRLVETLAEEWQTRPIDINSIAPGALSSRLTQEVLQAGANAAGESEISLARRTAAQTSEGYDRLGKLVEFLLSAASDGITGKLISAPWDHWETFGQERERLQGSELLTLRRVILPEPNA